MGHTCITLNIVTDRTSNFTFAVIFNAVKDEIMTGFNYVNVAVCMRAMVLIWLKFKLVL